MTGAAPPYVGILLTSTFPRSKRAEFPPRSGQTFVRSAAPAPDVPVWSRPKADLGKTLTLRAHYDALTGYGQLACGLLQELARQGVPCQGIPMGAVWEPEWGPVAKVHPAVRQRLVKENQEGWEVMMGAPHHAPKESPSIAITMWESNRLPEGTAGTLNRHQAIIVPSEWGILSMDAAGVTRPLYKLNLPVSDCFFRRPSERKRAGPFTVGMACRRGHGGLRKGVAEAVACFLTAFPEPSSPVRMRVKLYPDCDGSDLPRNPRVEIIQAAYTEQQMADWFETLDCYLSTSHAEGFGLCQAQSVAMGVPVIGASAHAQAEYLTEQTGYPVAYRLEQAQVVNPSNEYYRGFVFMPERESVVERLRECYRYPEQRRLKGQAAHDFALTRFRWSQFADGLLSVCRKEGLPI